MAKPKIEAEKKIYTCPEITIYGTVSQLTQHKLVSGRLDGGQHFAKTA